VDKHCDSIDVCNSPGACMVCLGKEESLEFGYACGSEICREDDARPRVQSVSGTCVRRLVQALSCVTRCDAGLMCLYVPSTWVPGVYVCVRILDGSIMLCRCVHLQNLDGVLLLDMHMVLGGARTWHYQCVARPGYSGTCVQNACL
jgi:hypothetical protein